LAVAGAAGFLSLPAAVRAAAADTLLLLLTLTAAAVLLQELLGRSACRLPYVLRQQPTTLGFRLSTMQAKLKLLQQQLHCSRDEVRRCCVCMLLPCWV
jgi:hypothetical protein